MKAMKEGSKREEKMESPKKETREVAKGIDKKEAKYPDNKDVLVIPADGISYDAVVHILERLKRARYSAIALGTRSRS